MAPSVTRRVPRSDSAPSYVHHHTFGAAGAAQTYAARGAGGVAAGASYMPDEVTRDHAERMHYAASRMHAAHRGNDRGKWRRVYLDLRDKIVLGNRKLIYRAVRQRGAVPSLADDMIGDSHIVLIHAVAAFNPWLNIRFSTYAYTCLIRAIARKARRSASDRLAHALSLEALPDGEARGRFDQPPNPASSASLRIEDFLRDDHPLLSAREKTVLARRFSLTGGEERPTLQVIGKAVGLSKERVRQVQAAAIGKLRKVLSPAST
jgi:RNA polymerase sigma factor (sigma-70 family)